jgi:trans-aconitate methyltransferase
MAAYPNLALSARANRGFLARAVRFLTAEAGIRQFLDIGTGIPTANNTHEVAQRVVPASRIVYVDHDPIVLAHARSLLSSTPEGACAYLEGDLREPEGILSAAADTLDFSQPVAVMLIAVMHFIGGDAQARSILDRLTAACVPGSFLALSHAAADIEAEQMATVAKYLSQVAAQKPMLRDRAGVTRLFDGLDLVEPGVVNAPQWRPDTPEEAAMPASMWCGVARKG